MKILCIIILAFPVFSQAQPGFEGIIEYRVSYSGTRENPKPGKISFFIKGGDLMIRTDIAGVPASRILFKSAENYIFMIDDSSKNVIKLGFMPEDENEGIGEVPEEYRKEYKGALDELRENSDTLENKFESTGESSRIAGYDCRKYRVVNQEGETEAYAWLSRDLRIRVPKSIGDNTGILRGLVTEYGFPLRIENLNKGEDESRNMILEARNVMKTALDPGLFRIPEDYHVGDLFGNFR